MKHTIHMREVHNIELYIECYVELNQIEAGIWRRTGRRVIEVRYLNFQKTGLFDFPGMLQGGPRGVCFFLWWHRGRAHLLAAHSYLQLSECSLVVGIRHHSVPPDPDLIFLFFFWPVIARDR